MPKKRTEKKEEKIETKFEKIEETQEKSDDQKTVYIATLEAQIKQKDEKHSNFLREIINCYKENASSKIEGTLVDLEDEGHLLKFVEDTILDRAKIRKDFEESNTRWEDKLKSEREAFDNWKFTLREKLSGEGKVISEDEIIPAIEGLITQESIHIQREKEWETDKNELIKKHAEEIDRIKEGYVAQIGDQNVKIDELQQKLDQAAAINAQQEETITILRSELDTVKETINVIQDNVENIKADEEKEEKKKSNFFSNIFYKVKTIGKTKKIIAPKKENKKSKKK